MSISFLGRKAISKDQLVEEICRRLTEQGYRWKIIEGDLMVEKNGVNIVVVFWESCNKTNLRTYFIFHYCDDNLKHFKGGVLDIITCMTNRIYRATPSMMLDKDVYSCRYECAVCNVDDFMAEFGIAYKNISDAVEYFYEKLQHVDDNGKNESNSEESINEVNIGDKYPWKEPIEEIMEKANNGDGESLLRIGICYQFGVYGFEKDKCKAAEFYHDAMKKNNYRAMFNLAALFSNADGIGYDHDTAIELLTRIEKESGSFELAWQAHLAKKQVDNLEQVKYLLT